MQGHPDGTAVVQQAPGHALPNPFGSVGGKAVVQGIVKFSGCRQQADAAFLYQIHQRHAPTGVLFGNADHQTEVGIHHLPDGVLVPFRAAAGKLLLLLGSQPGVSTDFPQKLAHIVFTGADRQVCIFFQKLCHGFVPLLFCIFSR